MNPAPILDLLQERTGLDPATLGTHAVHSVLRERLEALGVNESEFARRLADDLREFARLVADVVVPETWFFRGGGVFPHVAEIIRQQTQTRGSIFRTLSLPCSTGEEPYSLAIALCELGVSPERFTIDAIDLSPRAIDKAQRGIFGEFSFRQTPHSLRQRYFRVVGEGWEIDPSLRTSIRFQVGNLLNPALLLWEKPFDLVFCRNLFIYFTREARRRGTEAIARLVAMGGLLVVGHAESFPPHERRFERIEPREFFLSRRVQERSP